MIIFDWLIANIGTVVVGAAVVAAVALVIALMARDKKKGKGGCGCGCQTCAMAGKCHSTNTDADQKK